MFPIASIAPKLLCQNALRKDRRPGLRCGSTQTEGYRASPAYRRESLPRWLLLEQPFGAHRVIPGHTLQNPPTTPGAPGAPGPAAVSHLHAPACWMQLVRQHVLFGHGRHAPGAPSEVGARGVIERRGASVATSDPAGAFRVDAKG